MTAVFFSHFRTSTSTHAPACPKQTPIQRQHPRQHPAPALAPHLHQHAETKRLHQRLHQHGKTKCRSRSTPVRSKNPFSWQLSEQKPRGRRERTNRFPMFAAISVVTGVYRQRTQMCSALFARIPVQRLHNKALHQLSRRRIALVCIHVC